MDKFNLVAGIASILSFFLALFTLGNVISIKNSIKIYESTKTEQNMKLGDVSGSTVNQVGRDKK